ncbi:MAG: hypothetical protein A2X86_20620 [Bdellovibrionales bacterium GWA2_49_15]|nr:MAG: hypothetical protein A2X86_20620 [Bdellovibrionales bacterium GWA2_49_15]
MVRDLMTKDLFTLYDDDTLNFADEVMNWKRIRHIPIINHNYELQGVLTHRDLLALSISQLAALPVNDQKSLHRRIRVGDVIRKSVTTTSPGTRLKEAAKIMFEKKIGCLPVVEHGRLVGIITEADFVKFFIEWRVEKDSGA